MFYIYKMRCGTVSLNAPWGLVTSHPKSSAAVSSTTISTLTFSAERLHVTSCMRLIFNPEKN